MTEHPGRRIGRDPIAASDFAAWWAGNDAPGGPFVARLDIDAGWIEFDTSEVVRVGDHHAPARLNVHLEGGLDEPAVDLVIETTGGVPQCVDVQFHAKPDRGVRGEDLRALAVDRWLRAVVPFVAERVTVTEGGRVVVSMGPGDPLAFDEAVQALRAARKGKRRRLTPEDLDRVAQTHQSAPSGDRTRTVATTFYVSTRTAERYVQQAREAGLL